MTTNPFRARTNQFQLLTDIPIQQQNETDDQIDNQENTVSEPDPEQNN